MTTDDINRAYASVAVLLRGNGYSPIPLAGKQPRMKGWQKIFCDRMPSIDEIVRDWSSSRLGAMEQNGVGVANVGGLIIIDVDDDLAVEHVLSQLPQARGAPTCVGHRGCKIFLRSADQTERQATSDAENASVVGGHDRGASPCIEGASQEVAGQVLARRRGSAPRRRPAGQHQKGSSPCRGEVRSG